MRSCTRLPVRPVHPVQPLACSAQSNVTWVDDCLCVSISIGERSTDRGSDPGDGERVGHASASIVDSVTSDPGYIAILAKKDEHVTVRIHSHDWTVSYIGI